MIKKEPQPAPSTGAPAGTLSQAALYCNTDGNIVAPPSAAALVPITIPKPTGGTTPQDVLRELEWPNAFRR